MNPSFTRWIVVLSDSTAMNGSRPGSFKERGARYTLLMMEQEQKEAGVIAASAGNHAQALAYHGGQLGK